MKFNSKGGRMKAFSYAALMLFCLITQRGQTLHAADLYAFLVGDYFSQDIQQASRKDLQNMHEETIRIAKYANYKLKASFFAEGKSNGTELLKAIKKLAPKKEDMVLFYFSGHGYRTTNHGTNLWPYLDFPSEHQGMSFHDIIVHIANLKPRLTILIADCCNWTIPYGFINPPLLKRYKPEPVPTKRLKRNYQKLFCKTEGLLAIAGAEPGQASYCKIYGSFYTLSFLSSLQEVLQCKSGVNWKSVLAIAENSLIDKLKPYNLNQQPVVWYNLK